MLTSVTCAANRRTLQECWARIRRLHCWPAALTVAVYAHVDRASESGLANARAIANGSEFISRDLDLWAYQRDVVRDFSRPGKPTDNAYIESFNGKFRAECLNQHWFLNL